jgi:hypothetical protein
VRLLEWLHTAKVPQDFALRAGEHVVDGSRFQAKLIADLAGCQNTALFTPALDRARRVRSLLAEAANSYPDSGQTDCA